MAPVIDCPSCGAANPQGSRFCNSCGATLFSRVGVQERRVVTALFADLARSTAMGERLDPELVRGLVGQFFELATREIERRGGTVEKFSGDAVMAVFGLRQAHEDDPERAVRAALAIRDGLAKLSHDAEERHGVALRARIGIEAGEVVVGDPFGGATMATGDAMNVAARLEQQAQPDDVVLGESAWEAVRGMAVGEPLGDLALRGHEGPIAGWRVLSIASEVGRPRGVPGVEAPLTGRDEELALLLDAADRARRERKAVLFTILGVPGVGKSRLVRETTARLAARGWLVVRGRCLPYGDGITYWPLAEIVRDLAAIDVDTDPDEARRRLTEISPDAEVGDRVALALGLSDGPESAAAASASAAGADQSGAGAKEIAWAFRRLIEHTTERNPVVVVFDDIHWAEPPLLELIEYLATWTRDAPLLILCPSRPELLDTRPGWASGRMEAGRISLEPLTAEESRALLAALLAVDELPAELRQRVLDRAEGNPLFVEEVVRMLIEEGVVQSRDGHWFATQDAANVRVPDSVEALIRARLDTVPAPERVVLQAASVVGRVFQRSAVVALAPPDQVTPPIEQHLEDAILRDLITEERSPDEPTFRFRHILIRDVAYNSLPKVRRADLHDGAAGWLRAWAGSRMDEFVEIVAYHLEQAVQLRQEVGERVDSTHLEAAVDALASSAAKAAARDDRRAVRTFVERALALDPSAIETRLDLWWIYVEALASLGENTRAGELAGRLEQAARAAGRADIEGRATYAKAGGIWVSPDSADAPAAVAELHRAKALLEAAGDWKYLAHVLEFIGYEGWWHGQFDRALLAWQEMADVARARGVPALEAQALMDMSKVWRMRGQTEEARRLLGRARELAEQGGNRLIRARVERVLGQAVALTESSDEGRQLLTSSSEVLEELGDFEEFAVAQMFLGDLSFRDGDLEGALAHYRRSIDAVQDHIGYRPELKRRIASVLLSQGHVSDAATLAEEATRETAKDDWATVAITHAVLGQVRAVQGRHAEAEDLLRKAAEVISGTEFPKFEQYLALAEFLVQTGRANEGLEWLERAKASVREFPSGPMMAFQNRRASKIEAEARSSMRPEGTGSSSPE